MASMMRDPCSNMIDDDKRGAGSRAKCRGTATMRARTMTQKSATRAAIEKRSGLKSCVDRMSVIRQ